MNEHPSIRSQREATARVRAEKALALNETLLWCGRPVPTSFYPGWWKTFLAGVFWCIIMSVLFRHVLFRIWTDYLSGEGAQSLWAVLGETVFFVPFAAIGIFLLLMPLWGKLALKLQVYAVTDQRAMVIGAFSTHSWRVMEMQPVSRSDWSNGLTDLFFALGYTGEDSPPKPVGFPNLSTSDAPAALAALERLRSSSQSGGN